MPNCVMELGSNALSVEMLPALSTVNCLASSVRVSIVQSLPWYCSPTLCGGVGRLALLDRSFFYRRKPGNSAEGRPTWEPSSFAKVHRGRADFLGSKFYGFGRGLMLC